MENSLNVSNLNIKTNGFTLHIVQAGPADLCDDGRLEFVEETGHFVQHEEPERVTDLIVAFLRKENVGQIA